MYSVEPTPWTAPRAVELPSVVEAEAALGTGSDSGILS